ncbi:MAG: hypothetical protein KAX55_04070 [Propionivibrio sp.]|nr:hypothetical protein [Propionivibrio sp.]
MKANNNADALRTHKADSQKDTRLELELAVRRLVNGNPQRVKKGTPLSPAAVAAEAGVDRSTLYRYHEPVLTEIRRTIDATPQKKLREKSGELAAAMAKAKEYRAMLEAEQANLQKMARENYNLSARVRHLESAIERHLARIAELEEAQRKVTTIPPPGRNQPA